MRAVVQSRGAPCLKIVQNSSLVLQTRGGGVGAARVVTGGSWKSLERKKNYNIKVNKITFFTF